MARKRDTFIPDFAPLPARRAPWKIAGDVTPLHVRCEPIAGARWKAWTFKPGDQYPTSTTGRGPHDALTALLEHPPPGPPYRQECDECNGLHSVVMDSPAGDSRCHWYCPDCEHRKRHPKRRPK